jgi:CheY-like chemotaxis protein
VLLVDDNPLFLRILSAILEDAIPSFSARGVTTGSAAVAYVSARGADAPDFVVLDFHLPDMDAPEVLKHLRGVPEGAALPVLVLTQAYWAQDESAAIHAGATAFHAKPSSLAELRCVVMKFWEENVAVG